MVGADPRGGESDRLRLGLRKPTVVTATGMSVGGGIGTAKLTVDYGMEGDFSKENVVALVNRAVHQEVDGLRSEIERQRGEVETKISSLVGRLAAVERESEERIEDLQRKVGVEVTGTVIGAVIVVAGSALTFITC